MASILLGLVPLLGLVVLGHVIVNIIKASKTVVKGKDLNDKLLAFEEDLSILEQELDDSRHRIEVLETIVTSEKRDLNQSFDAMSGSR
ncbi:MAG: hypothetical protein ACI9CE_000770 [Flavobacterium sp.]|jgi:hypothetical protein